MKLHARFAVPLLLSAVALALGLSACSRSQHVSDSLTGPAGGGAGGSMIGASGRAGDGNFAPAAPCPALLPGTPDAPAKFISSSALVASFRANRLRIDTSGEVAGNLLSDMGPCATDDNPSIRFISGHADVVLHGTNKSITVDGQPLEFGPLLSQNRLIAPGVVFATDARNDLLEIIWPALAGTGAGGAIVRVQLSSWNPLLVSSGESYDVVFDFTAERDGGQMFIKGHADNLRLDGVAVPQEGAASPPACPPSLAGTDGAVLPVFATVAQFRANRLRLEVAGDVQSGIIHATGACATASPAAISYLGGTGNVFRAGTHISVTSTSQPIVFGPLAVPLTLEAGVVLNIDASGNVLEIIWPGLAGLPPGPPIFRFQLASWNSWVRTGQQVDVSMRFDALGPDGTVATYTVDANNILVPGLK